MYPNYKHSLVKILLTNSLLFLITIQHMIVPTQMFKKNRLACPSHDEGCYHHQKLFVRTIRLEFLVMFFDSDAFHLM